MSPNPLYAACINRAAALLGGFEPLGERLHISPRTLSWWAKGVGAPTDAQFLDLVDLLDQLAPPPGTSDAAGAPPSAPGTHRSP